MTVQELLEDKNFRVINNGDNGDTEISGVFCCDLLSIVMSSAPADCVWVTIMNNINTLAVSALTDCAVVILAAGIPTDEAFVNKAAMQGITVLSSEQPIFETALLVHEKLK